MSGRHRGSFVEINHDYVLRWVHLYNVFSFPIYFELYILAARTCVTEPFFSVGGIKVGG